jgi:uncharacterized protein (DUF1919 family)
MRVQLATKINNIRFLLGKILLNKKLVNNTFTIISNDCWGGEVYKWFNIPFSSPFIGLMIMAPDYLKLLKSLKRYIEFPLVFKKKSKYYHINKIRTTRYFPIGRLDDVEILFFHYKTENEALEKWNRRKNRINYKNLFVKFDGSKDLASQQNILDFISLSFHNKICFVRENNINSEYIVKIDDYNENGSIQFKKSLKNFNIMSWLNGEGYTKRGISKIIYYIFFADHQGNLQ